MESEERVLNHIVYVCRTNPPRDEGPHLANQVRPRSNTVSPGFNEAIAWGLPHPSPRLAPSGTAAISSAL